MIEDHLEQRCINWKDHSKELNRLLFLVNDFILIMFEFSRVSPMKVT